MKSFKVEVEGTTPLLCNRFGETAEMAVSTSHRSSMVGDSGSPRDKASAKLYLGENGKPMIPGPNLFRSLIDAGKFFKNGKSKVTTQKSSLIPAFVAIHEVEIPIITKVPWDVDCRPVRIPSTGGRIMAYRPRFNEWKLGFTLELLDEREFSPQLLRQIVDAAGSRVGLGDFRPDCKGPFGKFVVTRWTTD